MRPENDDQGGSLPLEEMLQIDQVCTRFEDAWKKAPPLPLLEDFLGDARGLKRDALLRELLPLDLEFRQEDGPAPTVEKYLARFPGHEALIREEVERHGPRPEVLARIAHRALEK